MRMRKKPAGWPDYMRPKRLKNGTVAYFWEVPSWARKRGCSMQNEALGADYGEAKLRCDQVLNPQFTAWRTKGAAPDNSAGIGTFDWMVGLYKAHRKYTSLPQKTRKSIDAALALASKHKLKDGRLFGALQLTSITPGAADKLYEKLSVRADGSPRIRTALLSMQYCRRAWKVARREKPKIVPIDNPFVKMEIEYTAKRTRPVKHDELLKFVAAADAAGEPSIGTAAMLAFYWLQRQVDILSRLTWAHYRPSDAPDVARVWHHKTGEVVDIPLFDADGTALWPELTARLDAATRRGTLIVMRDNPDKRDKDRKTYRPWNQYSFIHRVAEIRADAEIDPEVKFMGLRHGGNTEGADAGLTDAQLRALSGHRSTAALLRYAQQTKEQRQIGARKRLDVRTKRGTLSE